MDKNREGRTLLIMKDQDIDTYTFKNVISDFKSDSGTRFIEFNSVVNCKKVLEDLISKNIKCKYSYYNLFFRITKNLTNINIIDFKKLLINKLELQYPSINILDINLYMKNNRLIGSGYIIIDRIKDFNKIVENNKLIISEDNEEEFFTFYKFIRK
tara:strand:- start:32 stop:499 length:468 start_codon:yes stop_codon:yes gene_type:complete